jgi:hypothetical protein
MHRVITILTEPADVPVLDGRAIVRGGSVVASAGGEPIAAGFVIPVQGQCLDDWADQGLMVAPDGMWESDWLMLLEMAAESDESMSFRFEWDEESGAHEQVDA